MTTSCTPSIQWRTSDAIFMVRRVEGGIDRRVYSAATYTLQSRLLLTAHALQGRSIEAILASVGQPNGLLAQLCKMGQIEQVAQPAADKTRMGFNQIDFSKDTEHVEVRSQVKQDLAEGEFLKAADSIYTAFTKPHELVIVASWLVEVYVSIGGEGYKALETAIAIATTVQGHNPVQAVCLYQRILQAYPYHLPLYHKLLECTSDKEQQARIRYRAACMATLSGHYPQASSFLVDGGMQYTCYLDGYVVLQLLKRWGKAEALEAQFNEFLKVFHGEDLLSCYKVGFWWLGRGRCANHLAKAYERLGRRSEACKWSLRVEAALACQTTMTMDEDLTPPVVEGGALNLEALEAAFKAREGFTTAMQLAQALYADKQWQRSWGMYEVALVKALEQFNLERIKQSLLGMGAIESSYPPTIEVLPFIQNLELMILRAVTIHDSLLQLPPPATPFIKLEREAFERNRGFSRAMRLAKERADKVFFLVRAYEINRARKLSPERKKRFQEWLEEAKKSVEALPLAHQVEVQVLERSLKPADEQVTAKVLKACRSLSKQLWGVKSAKEVITLYAAWRRGQQLHKMRAHLMEVVQQKRALEQQCQELKREMEALRLNLRTN